MTIKKPEPYCWAVQSQIVCWTWQGENAELLARETSRSSNVSQPFPLYKEPPVASDNHFANVSKMMQIGTARELLSIAALEILGLKPSTKLYMMPESQELPVTEESSADQPMQDEDLAGVLRVKELANREFVGLTQDEIDAVSEDIWGCAPQKANSFAYALGVKLKEKNQ